MKQNEKRGVSPYIALGLFLMFAGPVIAAWLLFYYGDDWLNKTTNRGTLIQPVIDTQSIPELAKLKDQWQQVLIYPEVCEQNCLAQLAKIQRIRRALGKKQTQIDNTLLLLAKDINPKTKETLSENFKETRILVVDKLEFAQIVASIPNQREILNEGMIVLIDPQGFLMMSYELEAQPDDIYHDLNRLLH